MRMCQPHWDRLKEEIAKVGLWPFVASSGSDLVERLKKELGDQLTIPDPLNSCNFRIWSAALERAPYLIFRNSEIGENDCPLCDVKLSGQNIEIPRNDLDEDWIIGCVDDCKKHFIKEGFLREN